jgi:hypothetical protein
MHKMTSTRRVFSLLTLAVLFAFTAVSAHAQDGDLTEQERPLLLAHYMPWYQTPDVSGAWGWHWTMDHFNPAAGEIASQYTPLTGPYDSQDEAILEYQVLLMKLSGIDGVIVDWYGPDDFNDYAAINGSTLKLFAAIQRAGLRFAIMYEDRTLIAMTDAGYVTDADAVEHGTQVMEYLQETWFTDPAYVTFNGQPLLFSFGPLYFRDSNQWNTMLAEIEPTPLLVTLDNYLSFGAASSFPWPPMHLSAGIELPQQSLDDYLERFYRNARRRDFIVGTAFPGFFDIYEQAGVRSSYGFIDAKDGATFRYTLDLALQADASIIQLATWNDYGEGTTIEPTEEYGYQYLEMIQETRSSVDASFATPPDVLRLPLQLLNARRASEGDADANTQLDEAFAALVSGDTDSAEAILAGFE